MLAGIFHVAVTAAGSHDPLTGEDTLMAGDLPSSARQSQIRVHPAEVISPKPAKGHDQQALRAPLRFNLKRKRSGAHAIKTALATDHQRQPPGPRNGLTRPQRIVSLNICTDQLLMLLVDDARIAGVSHLSHRDDTSVMAERARRLPVSYVQAEDIYLKQPDLVLTMSFGTGPQIEILRRLGLRVEVLTPASSFDDIRNNLRQLGAILGEAEKAIDLIAAFDARLSQAQATFQDTKRPVAGLNFANGFTAGRGTLADEIVRAAGLENLAGRYGLTGNARLPLELLVLGEPDLIVEGRSFDPPSLAQMVFAHPALDHLKPTAGHAVVADRNWICGTPHVADAVETLAALAARIRARP